jgi:hypothetical protein
MSRTRLTTQLATLIKLIDQLNVQVPRFQSAVYQSTWFGEQNQAGGAAVGEAMPLTLGARLLEGEAPTSGDTAQGVGVAEGER